MKHKYPFILIVYFLVLVGSLRAEEKSPSDNFHHSGGWATLGIGSSYFGPTLYMNLSYTYNNNLFTVRYLRADESRFTLSDYEFEEPPLSIKEVGILYGRSYRNDILVFDLSAGIAYAKGINRGNNIEGKKYESVNISTFGMPFEAKFRFELGYIGLGLAWYGNLNAKKSFSGVVFEVLFGVF